MNTERIKKLQHFANEFNQKLKLSEESQIKENKLALLPFNKRIKKSYSTTNSKYKNKNINYNLSFLNQSKNIQKIKRAIKSSKKKQGKLSNNIYKNLLPWIPPHYIGSYFDNFKILQDKHNLSAWEKVRNNLFFIF